MLYFFEGSCLEREINPDNLWKPTWFFDNFNFNRSAKAMRTINQHWKEYVNLGKKQPNNLVAGSGEYEQPLSSSSDK
jgi:hypothetical protein